MDLMIDLETYSSVDLVKAGLYRYAQSEDFEILLLAYKYDNLPTCVIDIASGEEVPEHVVHALTDPTITKHAYNAAFEIYCLNQAGYHTEIDQWVCTMVHGMYCGYPAGLAAIGKALGLPEEKQKMTVGKALIRYFCQPCKPTKTNGGRTRNLPHHEPDKWQLFKEYNAQDVETEYEIERILSDIPMPDDEIAVWHEDIRMNTRGVRVDRRLVAGALSIDETEKSMLTERAKEITGLANPGSNPQVLGWLREQGLDVNNVTKATVADLLAGELPENVREFLGIRQMLAKTSVTKYDAMARSMSERDDRVRGLLQYYGASRTGRYAGRLVQVQNLPRNYLSTLGDARELVRAGNHNAVKMIYGDVADTLSQLIRTAFIPSDGRKFIVSDFSAIEARVIAWLAGEEWVNEVFRTTGRIYEATAAQMFHVDEDRIRKGNPEYALRQKGKIATLALGYQGGPGAMIAMGATKMGIAEEELPEIVQLWRHANPHIVRMWYEFQECAEFVIANGGAREAHGIVFAHEIACGTHFMTIRLPSGRKLYYCAPYLDNGHICHYGQNQTTRKWEVAETYGGKLTENIVQATARDCLVVTMMRLIDQGYEPVMHIHDEVVIDADMTDSLEDVNRIFATPIDWAPGLVLTAAGFESSYYMKD